MFSNCLALVKNALFIAIACLQKNDQQADIDDRAWKAKAIGIQA
jgi:hypothetical protein